MKRKYSIGTAPPASAGVELAQPGLPGQAPIGMLAQLSVLLTKRLGGAAHNVLSALIGGIADSIADGCKEAGRQIERGFAEAMKTA